MNYSVSHETGTGTGMVTRVSKTSKLMIDHEKNGEGMTKLKKGQQITGMVIAVGEQVTLDFDGQKVTTLNEELKNTVPGERKTFEIVKISSSEIELKLLGRTAKEPHQTIKAAMIKDMDWESVLAQKDSDTKQAEKERLSQETKLLLEAISTRFTERDCQAIEKEGFPVESLSVGGLYEAISRVKAEATLEVKNTKVSTGKVKEEDIITLLKEENLPVTEENLGRINKAIALSDTVSKIDDKAMKYLISKDAEPTIENIYKAYYSGSTKHQEKKQELSSQAWSELEIQVKSVIENAGYKTNKDNLSEARWLIENKLPLTEETFTYKKELGVIKANADRDRVLDCIVEGMKNGTAPKDVTLVSQNDTALQQIVSEVNSISNEAVTYAVKENAELTIRRLTSIQEGINSGKIVPRSKVTDTSSITSDIVKSDVEMVKQDNMTTKPNVEVVDEYINSDEVDKQESSHQDPSSNGSNGSSGNSKEYEEIRAQRLMEEIRLKMTLESAGRLEKKGFNLETKKLERVVEELRKLEDSYYKKMLSEADIQSTEESIQTLKATTQSLSQLRFVPSYILGSTLSERGTQTIPSLLTEGTKLQAEFIKAGTAYETLMTVPNSEYGDSLRKAFANMDSLLSEMNIENTEHNQRAVRILSYNRMEITQEAIDRVKAYDKEVTTLMENLHPAVTVRMIKEGINPLHMPIGELNTAIDKMKEEQGITSVDKFSTYLHRLEKENGITEEQRKAYIGVYRLLYNVGKSDGAALGAVIKADQEVTLSHLLTAVQTGKKGNLEATINDEFGTLTSLSRNKESIAEQLSSFHASTDQQGLLQSDAEGRAREITQYLDRILKQITEELSPEKLKQLQQAPLLQDNAQTGAGTSSSQAAAREGVEDSALWETIKNTPVEKLLEQLQNTRNSVNLEEERYTQKVQQIRELCKNSEHSIRFLNDFHMTSTPQTISLANHLLNNADSPIVRLLKRQNENSNENLEKGLKELVELSDTLIDKTSMEDVYESLEAKAKTELDQACSEEILDSRKLIEHKSTWQQMSFLRELASKEFYQIPIETKKGITNINLTILRGSEKAGRLSVSVSSEQLGDIKADFSLKDQLLKGFISCDNRNGLDKLQTNSGEIDKVAKENNIILKQMDFGIYRRENDNYSYQNPVTGEQSVSVGNNTEKILYRLAKAIVETIRLTEDS